MRLHTVLHRLFSICLVLAIGYACSAPLAGANGDCSSRLAVAYMELMKLGDQGTPDADEVAKKRQSLALALRQCPVSDEGISVPLMGIWSREQLEIAADEVYWVSTHMNLVREQAQRSDTTRLYPLHIAAGFGSREMVELLISSKFDVNQKRKNGETPLMVSAYMNLQTAGANSKALIEAGADVNAIADNGSTALYYAVFQGDIRLTRILLDAGANVHPAGSDDNSIVDMATKRGDPSIVALIVHSNAAGNH